METQAFFQMRDPFVNPMVSQKNAKVEYFIGFQAGIIYAMENNRKFLADAIKQYKLYILKEEEKAKVGQ